MWYLGVRGVEQVEHRKFGNHGKYRLKPVGDNWELFKVFEFMYIFQADYCFALLALLLLCTACPTAALHCIALHCCYK